MKNKQSFGFPRYKSLYKYRSFILKDCGWKITNNILNIPKAGIAKIKMHRPLPDNNKIKTICIKKTKTNKWYVLISLEMPEPSKLLPLYNSIGIDMGCSNFIADSDGNIIKNPKELDKNLSKIKNIQNKLKNKTKNSINYRKTLVLLNKQYEKIHNKTTDFHYKIIKKYIQKYGTIIREDLSSWISETNDLNRLIRDVSWMSFFNKLECKAEEAGRIVIKVAPQYTSQICSSCGEIVPKTLSQRIHSCKCGLVLDRDINAAINILRLGVSLQDGPMGPSRKAYL